MFRSIKILLSIILFLISIGFPKPLVMAEDETVGYSVRAIIPDNQIDINQTYFDLKMKPEQKQTLEVEVFNSTNEVIEVNCHITNAVTNRSGLIDYTNLHPKLDDTLKYPMTEIATIEEEKVIIQASETKKIPINLKMPEDPFGGVILGGIYFEKSPDKEEAIRDSVQIDNKYAYVIGLKLTETDKEHKPNLHLKSIDPSLVNYRTAVIANIQNSEPVIVDNLKLDAQVLDSKGKMVQKKKVEDFRMAPNTTMEFVIDWDNDQLSPGKYSLLLHASDGEQEWNWDETFEIAKEERKQLNEESVEQDKNMIIYIVIGLICIILLLVLFLIKLRKENKRLKER